MRLYNSKYKRVIKEEEVIPPVDTTAMKPEPKKKGKIEGFGAFNKVIKKDCPNCPEPMLLGMVQCIQDELNLPFGKGKIKVSTFSVLIVFFDVILVIIIMIYVHFLDSSTREFIEEFKKHSVEIDKFTVRIQSLP